MASRDGDGTCVDNMPCNHDELKLRGFKIVKNATGRILERFILTDIILLSLALSTNSTMDFCAF
jgi:hypothetical protein